MFYESPPGGWFCYWSLFSITLRTMRYIKQLIFTKMGDYLFKPVIKKLYNNFHWNCYIVFSVYFFFFIYMWVFFHEHSRIAGLQGKGEGISFTPHYYFHPLHRHLDISWAITAETSAHNQQPDSNREPLISQRKLLTTKLHALRQNS